MTDIKVVRDWMNRYNFFTCEPTRELVIEVSTAEEFYNGLDIVNHFFTGIANNHPAQALELMMGCIKALLPVPEDEVLAEARAVAVNPGASTEELKKQARILSMIERTRKAPPALRDYYNLIFQLTCWRLGRMVKMISVVISSKIVTVLRKTYGDDNAQQTVLTEMKKLLPFDKWLEGITEEAYAAKPYG